MQASYPTLVERRYRKSEKIFAIDRGATVLDSVLKYPHPQGDEDTGRGCLGNQGGRPHAIAPGEGRTSPFQT